MKTQRRESGWLQRLVRPFVINSKIRQVARVILADSQFRLRVQDLPPQLALAFSEMTLPSDDQSFLAPFLRGVVLSWRRVRQQFQGRRTELPSASFWKRATSSLCRVLPWCSRSHEKELDPLWPHDFISLSTFPRRTFSTRLFPPDESAMSTSSPASRT